MFLSYAPGGAPLPPGFDKLPCFRKKKRISIKYKIAYCQFLEPRRYNTTVGRNEAREEQEALEDDVDPGQAVQHEGENCQKTPVISVEIMA